jgi:hypothetical protein
LERLFAHLEPKRLGDEGENNQPLARLCFLEHLLNLGFRADVVPAGQDSLILRELRERRLADFFRSLSRGVGDDEDGTDLGGTFGHGDMITDLLGKTKHQKIVKMTEFSMNPKSLKKIVVFIF